MALCNQGTSESVGEVLLLELPLGFLPMVLYCRRKLWVSQFPYLWTQSIPIQVSIAILTDSLSLSHELVCCLISWFYYLEQVLL